MKRIIANVACVFMPSKKIRHAIRNKIAGDRKFLLAERAELEEILLQKEITLNNLGIEGVVIGDEIFTKLSYDFNTDRPCVYIDIGSNIGIASLYFAHKEHTVHVYGFEPFVPTYEQAQMNVESNPRLADRISLFNVGLSDKKQSLSVRYNPLCPGNNSTNVDRFSSNDDFVEESILLEPASEHLRPIIEKHEKEYIVLKVDTEGGEYGIFNDLNRTGLLQSVDCIMMEWHKFVGMDVNPMEITDILSKNGFMYFLRDANLDVHFDESRDYGGLIFAVRNEA